MTGIDIKNFVPFGDMFMGEYYGSQHPSEDKGDANMCVKVLKLNKARMLYNYGSCLGRDLIGKHVFIAGNKHYRIWRHDTNEPEIVVAPISVIFAVEDKIEEK